MEHHVTWFIYRYHIKMGNCIVKKSGDGLGCGLVSLGMERCEGAEGGENYITGGTDTK